MITVAELVEWFKKTNKNEFGLMVVKAPYEDKCITYYDVSNIVDEDDVLTFCGRNTYINPLQHVRIRHATIVRTEA